MPQITARITQDSEGDESPFEKDVYRITALNDDTIAQVKDTLCSMAIRAPVQRDNLTIMHGDMQFDDDVFVGDIIQTMEVLKTDSSQLTVKYESASTADFLSGLQPSIFPRMLICLDSEIPRLQNENALFEVNGSTSVAVFTRMIIARMDEFSVIRTFPEQVLFEYADKKITQAARSQKIQDAFRVQEDRPPTQGEILHARLLIEDITGRSIFSRAFFDDLRSDTSLTFLPQEETLEMQNNGGAQFPTVPHITHSAGHMPVEPTRVVTSVDGPEYTLTGRQLELIEANTNEGRLALWVDPADLALAEFQIECGNGAQSTSVSLSTLQCIIVDNGKLHQPYMLLSPSGAAKMCTSLRDGNADETLLQQVEIRMVDETAPAEARRHTRFVFNFNTENWLMAQIKYALIMAVRHLYQFLRATLQVIPFMSFLKLGLMLRFFNFTLPHLSYGQWWRIALFASASALLYIVFGIGDQVAARIEGLVAPDGDFEARDLPAVRQAPLQLARLLRLINRGFETIAHGILTEIIRIGVSRRPAYEYLVNHQDLQRWEIKLWWQIRDSFDEMWKNALLLVVTIIPSWNAKVNEKLEEVRASQLLELEQKVRVFEEIIAALAKQYDRQFSTSFAIAAAMDPLLLSFPRLMPTEASHNSEAEFERYTDLVERMLNMRRMHKTLSMSLMSGTPHDPVEYQ